MLGNQNGIRGRLFRFGGLLFFCLVEKAGLVVQNIAVFLAGLTEPGPLSIACPDYKIKILRFLLHIQ